MAREDLIKKQKLRRKAAKAGIKGRKAQDAWAAKQVDKTGTTWINDRGKITQADAGRNKGRMFKEKAGDQIGNVRGRQKFRKNPTVGGALSGLNNWRKRAGLFIKKKGK